MSRPDHVATCEQRIHDAVMDALGNPPPSEYLFGERREAYQLARRKVHAALCQLAARVSADVRREVHEATEPRRPMAVTEGHCDPDESCLGDHRGAWCGACHRHYDPDFEAEHDAECAPCEECDR